MYYIFILSANTIKTTVSPSSYVIVSLDSLVLGILIRHDAMRQTLFHFACMLLQLKLALSYVTSLALAI